MREMYGPHDEEPLVNPSGLMQIPWPIKGNGDPLSEVDALLATTNEPSLTPEHDYHGVEAIARAWNDAPTRKEYFDKNRENGIRTFQDEDILQHLQPNQKPS